MHEIDTMPVGMGMTEVVVVDTGSGGSGGIISISRLGRDKKPNLYIKNGKTLVKMYKTRREEMSEWIFYRPKPPNNNNNKHVAFNGGKNVETFFFISLDFIYISFAKWQQSSLYFLHRV